MKIIMYKFRPIILSGGWLTLTNIMSHYVNWGSCPMGATIVNGKVWFTTTGETLPDDLWIDEYVGYDDDSMMDVWTNIYTEQTPTPERKGWSEPEQIIKTYNNGSVNVTVTAWLKNGASSYYLDLKVFHDSTLVYSDASRPVIRNYWDNDMIYFSDSGIIHIIFKPDAYNCYNLRSLDDGLTWTQHLISTHAYKPTYFYLSIGGYDNYVFAYFDWNLDIYRSADNGQTWTQLGDLAPPNLSDNAAEYGHSLIGLNGNLHLLIYYKSTDNILHFGIMKSTDNGNSWNFFENDDHLPTTPPYNTYWELNNCTMIKEGGFLYLSYWYYDRTALDNKFIFCRSLDGETWETVGTYFLPNRSSAPDEPAFLAKDGDLVVFTSYYLDSIYGPDKYTGVGLKTVIISEDGGITWRHIHAYYTDWDHPESYIKLEWSFPAGNVEIYRREHVLDYIGNWELIATVPATPSKFLDTTGYGNVPYDYYVHLVGDGNTPVQFIHGTNLYMGFITEQVILYQDKVFVSAYLSSTSYSKEETMTACSSDMILLLLEDFTQYSMITIPEITFGYGSTYLHAATISLNPLVFAYIDGVLSPGEAYVYWHIDGQWQGGLALTSEGMFTSMAARDFLIANADGTAVIAVASYKSGSFSRIIVAKTSDYGQAWTDPIVIFEWRRTATFTQFSAYGIYSNGIRYFIPITSGNFAMLLCSDDCSADSAFAVAHFAIYNAVAIDGSDVYLATMTAIYKILSSGTYMESVYSLYPFCIHVSPTYSADSTIYSGGNNPAGEIGLWKSTDGGDTWTKKLTTTYVVTLIDMTSDYSSSKIAFCYDNGGKLWKTIDGESWSEVSSGHSNASVLMVSPNFSSDNTVFLVFSVYNKHVYKSTNGGTTFVASETGIPISNWMVSGDISPNFASDQTIFVGGKNSSYYAIVYKSTDGGVNWVVKNTGISTYSNYVRGIAISPNYATDQTIFIGLEYIGIFKSTNGGDSWTLIYSMPSNGITRIQVSPNYASDQTVYVISSYQEYRSVDGGSTWTIIGICEADSLNCISIESTSPLFVGSYGNASVSGVYRSTTGVGFELIKSYSSKNVYALDVDGNYINLAYGNTTQLYVDHSTDGGLNFTTITLTPSILWTYFYTGTIRFSREGNKIILGGKGMYLKNLSVYPNQNIPVYFISDNNGASWTMVQVDYEYTHDEKFTDLLLGSQF